MQTKKEISDANFRVQYPESYDTDASNMLAWANQVVNDLQLSFPDLLSIIGSQVIIELKVTGPPGHDSADVKRPSIRFLARSVAIRENSYYDADYYIGNIAHELSHVMLDRYREMADGYQRSGCPKWFDEGFGEYLKLLVLGEQLFDTKYKWYTSEISKIISNGLSEITLSGITDVYAGGAWVLRFMDSEFGIDAIKAIITSSQPTFWAAVTEQTNLTQSQFEEQLKEWLKGRAT